MVKLAIGLNGFKKISVLGVSLRTPKTNIHFKSSSMKAIHWKANHRVQIARIFSRQPNQDNRRNFGFTTDCSPEKIDGLIGETSDLQQIARQKRLTG
jgi:hypothetical protein